MFRKKHSTSQYNPLLYSEARFEGEEFCKDQLLKGYYLIMQVKQNKNIYFNEVIVMGVLKMI